MELADGFRQPTLLDVHPPQSDVSVGKQWVRPKQLVELRDGLVIPSKCPERPPDLSADLPSAAEVAVPPRAVTSSSWCAVGRSLKSALSRSPRERKTPVFCAGSKPIASPRL